MSIQRPSVFSIQRGMSCTDGKMFSVIKVGDDYKEEPIKVVRHGIRGVLGTEDAHTKVDSKGTSNIQITETAKTSQNACGLAVNFAIKPMALSHSLFGCDSPEYRRVFNEFISEFAGSESLAEVCRRYARRIGDGSWMWRNLVLASEVEVAVKWGQDSVIMKQTRSKDFANYSQEERKLGAAIHAVLRGELTTTFNVKGTIFFGCTGGFEVFPSQSFVGDKPDGFARPLFKIDPISYAKLKEIVDQDSPREFQDFVDMGIAGLRDQKIGNAIRRIDTWYKKDVMDAPAVAVEPNGADLGENVFHRPVDNAFKFLGQIDDLTQRLKNKPGEVDPDSAYLGAVIIRGGVFGAQNSEKKAEKERLAAEKKAEKEQKKAEAARLKAEQKAMAQKQQGLPIGAVSQDPKDEEIEEA